MRQYTIPRSRLVTSTYPATSEDVEVRAAYTAVGDLDVDVGLFPRLGFKLSPDHVALVGVLVEAQPSYKLVVGGAGHGFGSVGEGEEEDLLMRREDLWTGVGELMEVKMGCAFKFASIRSIRPFYTPSHVDLFALGHLNTAPSAITYIRLPRSLVESAQTERL